MSRSDFFEVASAVPVAVVGLMGNFTSNPLRAPLASVTITPLISLGQSPSNFFTTFRKRILPDSEGSFSVVGWTSNLSLAYGRKSGLSIGICRPESSQPNSTINGRLLPLADFSHNARADNVSPDCGNFSFHDLRNAASTETFVSVPTLSVACTSPLPGMQTSLHSSHETLAFNSSAPGFKSAASLSGTSRTASP